MFSAGRWHPGTRRPSTVLDLTRRIATSAPTHATSGKLDIPVPFEITLDAAKLPELVLWKAKSAGC